MLGRDAENSDIWSFSITSFSAVIFVVTLKLMLFERFFSVLNFIAIGLLSLGIYYAYTWVSNYMIASVFSSMPITLSSYHYYFTMVISVAACIIPDLFIMAFYFIYKSNPVDFLRACASKKIDLDTDSKALKELNEHMEPVIKQTLARRLQVELNLEKQRELKL